MSRLPRQAPMGAIPGVAAADSEVEARQQEQEWLQALRLERERASEELSSLEQRLEAHQGRLLVLDREAQERSRSLASLRRAPEQEDRKASYAERRLEQLNRRIAQQRAVLAAETAASEPPSPPASPRSAAASPVEQPEPPKDESGLEQADSEAAPDSSPVAEERPTVDARPSDAGEGISAPPGLGWDHVAKSSRPAWPDGDSSPWPKWSEGAAIREAVHRLRLLRQLARERLDSRRCGVR
jgi:hypothetical protein